MGFFKLLTNPLVLFWTSIRKKNSALFAPIPIKLRTFVFFEDPKSSQLAFAVSCWAFVLTCLSIAEYLLASFSPTVFNDPDINTVWDDIEMGVTFYFTAEYLVRLAVSPCGQGYYNFITRPTNVLDLFACLPVYVQLIIDELSVNVDVSFIRGLRVFRMFRFVLYSSNLKMASRAFVGAFEVVQVLAFLSMVLCIVFSSLLYMAERDSDNKHFQSIPHSFFFTVTTFCTVGYGDDIPSTYVGRLIAGLGALTGMLCFALPTTLLSEVFRRERVKNKQRPHVEVPRTRAEALVQLWRAAVFLLVAKQRLRKARQHRRLGRPQLAALGRVIIRFFALKRTIAAIHQSGSAPQSLSGPLTRTRLAPGAAWATRDTEMSLLLASLAVADLQLYELRDGTRAILRARTHTLRRIAAVVAESAPLLVKQRLRRGGDADGVGGGGGAAEEKRLSKDKDKEALEQEQEQVVPSTPAVVTNTTGNTANTANPGNAAEDQGSTSSCTSRTSTPDHAAPTHPHV